jgi:hypothetical protein
MAYITARELRAVVPDQYRDAALSDQGGEPDPGLLSAVIDQACEEVDALIEGRVRLPLSTPFPQKIRTAAVYFALEILFTRRALEMPDATAKKIAGIRSDLGKVGAGDLRLEAPVEQTAASRQAGGSIVVRPSITGAGGMIGAIVLLLAGLAHPAKAIDPRTFSFLAPTNPMIESPDHMEWSQAESVELRYTLPAADNSREIRWEISDRTNLWLNLSPVRSGAVWSWSPSPTQTCLPPGRYDGRVAAYGRSGTNLTFHRVIAWQSIRVHSARDPQTLVMASPLLQTPEQDPVAMAAIASVTQQLADVVAPLATTGYVVAAVAPLATTQQLADAVAPLATTGDVAAAVGAITAEGLGALTAEADPEFSSWLSSDPLAPLATTGDVAAAVGAITAEGLGALTAETDPEFSAWLSTDPLAPPIIYEMLNYVGLETSEEDGYYYADSLTDWRTGASISFSSMHFYGQYEKPWNFVGNTSPTINGVPIATTQQLAEAVAPLLTNAATWWTYPAGGDVNFAGYALTNSGQVEVRAASHSSIRIEPGWIGYGSPGFGEPQTEIRFDDGWGILGNFSEVFTRDGEGLRIDDAIAMTESTVYFQYNSLPGLPATVNATNSFFAPVNLPQKMLTALKIATTNSYQKSNAHLRFSLDGNEIGTLAPRCDGSTQEIWFAAATGAVIEVEAFGLPSPAGDDGDPIITGLRFGNMGNPNLVVREMETANQIVMADYPQRARQVATKIYADDASAAALDLAMDEVWRRTQATDLQGNVLRFGPRYDVYGTNDAINWKYGGETMLQFDGTGSKVIPEIRSFSVGPGTTAEMTVWSYAGGETNLVPEVSTNLQDWLRLDASAIVSAAMLDQYTAKIVFTNSAPKAQFVRLVDVSGGEGDPVVRVLAAMELGGVKRTTWPGLPALDVVDVGDIPGEGSVEWTWTVNAAAPARTIVFSDPSATDKHPILIWPPPYTPAAVQEVKVISPPNGMSLAYAEEFDNAVTGETAYYAYTFYPAHNAWYLSGWSSEMYNLQPVITGWGPP